MHDVDKLWTAGYMCGYSESLCCAVQQQSLCVLNSLNCIGLSQSRRVTLRQNGPALWLLPAAAHLASAAKLV
jgi:hypothetical protein